MELILLVEFYKSPGLVGSLPAWIKSPSGRWIKFSSKTNEVRNGSISRIAVLQIISLRSEKENYARDLTVIVPYIKSWKLINVA